MDTLQQELDNLKAQHDKKAAQLVKEHSILSHLASIVEGYERPWVHFYSLYGAAGSIRFKGSDYDSIRKGNKPDAALFRALLAAYPPAVPFVKVKDGSVAFKPDIPENNEEREGRQFYDCGPVVVRVELFQSQRATFEWHTTIEGDLWRMEFEVPWYGSDLGQLGIVANRAFGRGEIVGYERCDLKPAHQAQLVKYASGGPQYPNSFTLYWDRDTAGTLDYPALAFKGVKDA